VFAGAAGATDGAAGSRGGEERISGGAYFGFDYVDPPDTATHVPEVVSIRDDEIRFASAGVRVWLELRFGGWGPNLLNTWQAGIDPADYMSGPGAALRPALQTCDHDRDCRDELGPGCRCREGLCLSGWQDLDREEFVIEGGLSLVDDRTLAYRYGSTVFLLPPGNQPVPDEGIEYYGGTLVIDVPAHAAGVYEFRLLTNGTTFITNSLGEYVPLTYPAIRLAFPAACCVGDGTCSYDDPETCVSLGGTVVPRCTGDCDGNGVNDACDVVVDEVLDCNADLQPDACDLPWDADGDGLITLQDYGLLARCIDAPCGAGGCGSGAGFNDPCCIVADIDGDGDVDLFDASEFHISVVPGS